MKKIYLLILLGAAGCSTATPEVLPESTTTMIDPTGGVAKSADGLMELRFTAGSLREQRAITIETRRDVTADRLVSLVYRVSPSPLEAPLEVSFRTGANARIGALDSGAFEPINQTIRDGENLRVSMSGLAYAMLAAVEEEVEPEPEVQPGGWEDPPASGSMFIVNAMAIAGDAGALASLGGLMNERMQLQLSTGELLVLVEVAGIDPGFLGDDESVTVKFYGAIDVDDPFFPANNFTIPPGQTSCCEFLIDAQSITADPPPRARSRAPGRIVAGRLETLTPVPLQFVLKTGAPPYPELRMERVLFTAELDANLLELRNGRLEGAFPMSTLAQWDNPFCKTVSEQCTIQFTESTILDLVTAMFAVQPDVDLDVPENGLSCVIDSDGDARIDRCCRANGGDCGGGAQCFAAQVPPIDNSHPGSCALNPTISDGYSVHFEINAVRASVVGIRL